MTWRRAARRFEVGRGSRLWLYLKLLAHSIDWSLGYHKLDDVVASIYRLHIKYNIGRIEY